MSTYTENYDLIKADEDDTYDVQVFNENFDVIDTLMAETENVMSQINEKIGNPDEISSDTLFGCLNTASPMVKSIQSVQFETATNSGTLTKTLDKTVDPYRCLVFMDRLKDVNGRGTYMQYSLNENTISFTATHADGKFDIVVKIQIIEFY